MQIILNEHNLTDSSVKETSEKSRAILTIDDKVLIANYGGVYLFPGGSTEIHETPLDAIKRELKEEVGISYSDNELSFLSSLIYYQKDYPMINGSIINRKLTTHYYIGEYKGIDLQNTSRTENERKDNFNLCLIKISELLRVINLPSPNPRYPYFNQEIKLALKYMKEKK